MKALSIAFFVLALITGGATYVLALLVASAVGGMHIVLTATFPGLSSVYWFIIFWANGYPLALHNVCAVVFLISVVLASAFHSKLENVAA